MRILLCSLLTAGLGGPGSLRTVSLRSSTVVTSRAVVGSDMFNPAQTVKVDRKDILSIEPSKTSPMPDGLLSSLTQEEVLDLLAYLVSGGRIETGARAAAK